MSRRSGPPALAPRRDDLRPALRLLREFRAAAVPRRGRARQRLDRSPGCRATSGRNSPTLRAYYGFMWGHPGKKLLFMGQEFGQAPRMELRAGPRLGAARIIRSTRVVQTLVRDLNRLYREHPALHARDCEPEGFRWIVADDAEQSVFAWLRFGAAGDPPVAVVSQLHAGAARGYRIGLPQAGRWREILNTDATDLWRLGHGQSRRGRGRSRSASWLSGFRRADGAAAGDGLPDPAVMLIVPSRPSRAQAGTNKGSERAMIDGKTFDSRAGSSLSRDAMAYVLAGGRGSRLMELTDRRAKPAVYFGGKSRIIDFALSNALNSGIRRIGVATQYKAHSLIRHLQRGWNFFRPERNESFDILPASQRVSRGPVVRGHRRRRVPEHRHHRGLRPRIHRHARRRPRLQDGLRADAAAARRRRAPTSRSAASRCRAMEATGFGVMHVDDEDRIVVVPREADRSAGHARQARTWRWPAWASTCSTAKFLFEQLRRDAATPDSSHDFGKDIIPYLVKHGKAVAHPLRAVLRALDGAKPRPIGATSARSTPIGKPTSTSPTSCRSSTSTTSAGRSGPTREITPPAKFVHDEDGRRGMARSLAGLRRLHHLRRRGPALPAVHRRARPFLCRGRERAWSCPYVRDRPAVPGCSNVVIDRGVRIPEGLVVGEDPELDAKRFRRTEKGICLITQPMIDRLAE